MTEAEEWQAVSAALRAAGIDPTDLGRFVNDPHPEIPGFEPETFDARAAHPVLLEWLPRVQSRAVVETLARRIAAAGKRSDSARALIEKYRADSSWALGDSIARTMTRTEHDDVVELCADRAAGMERQMLVYALWRVKTDRAREVLAESLEDPTVAGHAMTALRRAVGNAEARARLEPLLAHGDPDVRAHAAHALKRIDKALAR